MRVGRSVLRWAAPVLVAVQFVAAGCGDNSVITGGTIEHWNGSKWSLSVSTGGAGSRYLTGVWGSASNDVWAVGLGMILHWDGASWAEVVRRRDETAFQSVWGSGPDDVWATGSEIVHWDGATWSPVALPAGVGHVRRGFSPRPGDAWAAASLLDGVGSPPGRWYTTGVVRWDGTDWRLVWQGDPESRLGTGVGSIWGTSSDDVWAVGRQADSDLSLVMRWNGSAWSMSTLGGDGFSDVWGSGPHDVWAIGGNRGTVHWDGAGWSAGSGGMDAIDVWGRASDDVWIVGDFGGGVHWDGTDWSRFPAPESHGIGLGVWGSGPSDVWIVGGIEN